MGNEAAKIYHVGIDCGSKTVKIAVLDPEGNLAYKRYLYHQTNIRSTLARVLEDLREKMGDIRARFAFTGSAGMQIADDLNIPFVQEVVASKRAVEHFEPDTDVVIELGGEDSKILFLTGGEELRMNSTCAGGTGGFIDAIAGMLGTNAAGLALAYPKRTTTRPIASRCAVFAQNDVRSLLNEGAAKGDIAASAFAAVANQCISGLACGRPIEGKVVFLGGPLHYLDPLAESFREALGLDEESGIVPANAHLYVALGAALGSKNSPCQSLTQLEKGLSLLDCGEDSMLEYLDPLFESEDDYERFKEDHKQYSIPRKLMWRFNGPMYLGVDSGSTTMKAVLTTAEGEILMTHYQKNAGDVITSAKNLLKDLYQSMLVGHTAIGPDAYIAKVGVTGYGEALLKKAFGFDFGLVETVAHLKAAQFVMPDVDFVLDIGGQDIKCIRIRDRRIDDISLNEACSSGCGALLSSFARNMLMSDFGFAQSGLYAERPVDLGMRCTVFMTSRVRHAQKVGASAGDISAGLAYSVVKNALYRVMGVYDMRELGENVVVQGGTCKTDSVLRAFENTLGRQVARTDHPELMGAYGAALYAIEHDDGQGSGILDAFRSSTVKVDRSSRRCDLCTNSCLLTETSVSHSTDEARNYNPMIFVLKGVHSMGFDDTDAYRKVSARFIMGNRCPRPTAMEQLEGNGLELVTKQYQRVFKVDPPKNQHPDAVIGIPRALEMYEQFPFWQAFFGALGVRVMLSGRSTAELYRKGMSNVTSESTCYPAKLAHGHVADLLARGARHVFYPRLRNVGDAFDCPVICDYAHVLEMGAKSAGDGVAFISPRVSNALVEGVCSTEDATELLAAVRTLVPEADEESVAAACAAGVTAQTRYYEDVAALVDEAHAFMAANGGWGAVLACRPYHLDPEINHGIPTLLESSGMTVITSDALWAYMRREAGGNLANEVATRWRISDRQEATVREATRNGAFEIVSLYSFGCGIDVCLHDELRGLCRAGKTTFTALKVDDMTDISSTRIRVRSLLAALEERDGVQRREASDRDRPSQSLPSRPVPTAEGADPAAKPACPTTLLFPNWLPTHTSFIKRAFASFGFDIAESPSGTGVNSGVALVGSDPCQTILSSVGQLAEYQDKLAERTAANADADSQGAVPSASETADPVALVVPLACSSCTARSIDRLAKSTVKGFGAKRDVVTFEDLISFEGVPATLYEALARSIVAGDIITMASCKIRAHSRGVDFDSLAADMVASVLKAADERPDVPIDELALDAATQALADRTFADKTCIAVLGTASLALTPSLNNKVFDCISQEDCEPIPTPLAIQAIHNAIAEIQVSDGPRKEALESFVALLVDLQERAFVRLGDVGLGNAPALTFSRLCEVAREKGIDQGVNAGVGWCSQAAMSSLLESGCRDILFTQTFTCLSSHVGGSAKFKEVRADDPDANLSSVEYDTGISYVNQINRIKLLASLAKGAQDASL